MMSGPQKSIHRRKRQVCGFTLLEVLIVTVMTALLLGVLFSVLSTTGRVSGTISDSADSRDARNASIHFIRRELAQLVPLSIRDGGEGQTAFRGESDSVLFVSTIPSHLDVGGLFMVRFDFEEADNTRDGKSLVFRYRRFEPEDFDGVSYEFDDWKEKTLISGLEGLN